MSGHDTPATESVSHAALEAAAEWFALLRSAPADSDLRAQWQQWLEDDNAHREAWHYVEAVGRRFQALQGTTGPHTTASTLDRVRGRRVSRRQALGSLAGLIGTGMVAWASWRHTPLPGLVANWQADYRSAVGEIRQVRLDDGSRLWLNTASAVNTAFSPSLRRLRLVTGEILVETAGDPGRPFMVDTDHGSLRALGTRFTVRGNQDATQLVVFEGAVAIRPDGTAGETVVHAGEQARFNRDGLLSRGTADATHDAWSRGVILARDTPLDELVAELARYQRGHLGVDPDVAGLRVVGGYPAQDTERSLAMLADVLPITIHRPLPWWTTIKAANDSPP
ncbi:FecR domain-containing protein [Aquisalimonas asiatica]|uniref:FecR family protein n=1 Tax=Aquisalimonas asiatica TaxID=406100 RepID=A0A1H8SYL4_9GAMM|nr:FecR domain-containing protein [Aquisalimonas asiatica]SEO83444.1 FecR family protein [Aquisalimonas asiatica]